ncbi:MAG TPA: TonB-dependent receptor [Bryobacteraceae bacterium]|nr:TonB-dependent receptor [Bryobacteraceae bacterium]
MAYSVSDRLSFDPALSLYRDFGFYIQDDVQITRNLTAIFGLRYEYTQPWAEKWGRIGHFDFDGIQPVTGAKGTFRFLKPGEYQTDSRTKNFAPRVGLAYRFGGEEGIARQWRIFLRRDRYAQRRCVGLG